MRVVASRTVLRDVRASLRPEAGVKHSVTIADDVDRSYHECLQLRGSFRAAEGFGVRIRTGHSGAGMAQVGETPVARQYATTIPGVLGQKQRRDALR
jgi:hypothetical protein